MTENHLPKPARVCGRKRLKRHGVLANADALAQPVPNQEVNVGVVLHTLRAERDLTLRALAEKSGLAMNTLSLIENAKTSPCVATLQQLAFALGIPIAKFFENGSPKNRVVYIKAANRSGATFAHGMLEDLGVGLTDRTIEPFLITMKPTAHSGTQPIVHTGIEFVFCLEGRIVYTIEDKNHLLEPGDSLLFESHLPHRWQNVDPVPSRMLLVLCPEDSHDQSTQRHFLPEALEKTEPVLKLEKFVTQRRISMATVDLTAIQPAKVADARAMACPGPLLEAKKSIGLVKVGEVLEIWSGDLNTKKDMPGWCQKVGHEFLGVVSTDGYDRIFIRRKK